MKDRLTERISGFYYNEFIKDGFTITLYQAALIAARLIKNDIIMPPCKVGDVVYVINSRCVSEYTIKEIAYDGLFFRMYSENKQYAIECRTFVFFDERIGKTVFLAREEAEQALKEREQG